MATRKTSGDAATSAAPETSDTSPLKSAPAQGVSFFSRHMALQVYLPGGRAAVQFRDRAFTTNDDALVSALRADGAFGILFWEGALPPEIARKLKDEKELVSRNPQHHEPDYVRT